MKLLFKQRFFTWFDSYDIYNEAGETVFTVEGQLAWGHCLHVLDAQRNHIGTVQQVLLSFLPKFELYCGGEYMGCIRKELTLLFPKYDIDCNGWEIDGDFMQWDYRICDGTGRAVAAISKELMHLTDTYVIDVENPGDALCALMVVLAIDAEKCSQN